MTPDPRLEDLFRRWKEQRQEGRDVPPSELCADCPELTMELVKQIRAWKLEHPTNSGSSTNRRTIVGQDSRPSGTTAKPLSLALDAEPVPGFRLTALIAQGGFAEVWQALGPGGLPVALKCVRLSHLGGRLEVHSLEFIKQVRHANVLPIFGAWQSEAYLLLAMQLADQTLHDRLRTIVEQGETGLPFNELVEYMRDAAKGIDYLNGLGLQHRDIKPANLFLVGDSVKVGDFGLTKLLEASARGPSGGLTPAFAAPEFFRRQAADQSDQYSLAVSYCQLRGGTLPFNGSMEQMMHGHLMLAPDLSMLPEAEQPAVKRALSKNPKERWTSCRDFVEALAETKRSSLPRPSSVIAKPPVQRRPESTPAVKLTPEPPRMKWSAALVAMLLLVGAGAAVYGIMSVFREFKSALEAQPARPAPRPAPTRPTRPTGSVKDGSGANLVEAKYLEGRRALERRAYNEAVNAFTDAIYEDRGDARLYIYRGKAYMGLDRWDDAITDFTKAISIRPSNAMAYNERGNAYYAIHDYDQALTDYDKAIQMNAGDAVYFENRARVYDLMGNVDRAKADRERAAKIRAKK